MININSLIIHQESEIGIENSDRILYIIYNFKSREKQGST